jgi:hypothetical protein
VEIPLAAKDVGTSGEHLAAALDLSTPAAPDDSEDEDSDADAGDRMSDEDIKEDIKLSLKVTTCTSYTRVH